MLSDTLLVKVIEWGAAVVGAANTKAQQRSANVLGHAAFLAAGVRYLDRRFVALFVPLTMYDAASWPIEARRARCDEMLEFITSPGVIPRLATSVQWLEATVVDDPQERELVTLLCDTVKVGVWNYRDADVSEPPGSDYPEDGSWLDSVLGKAPPVQRGFRSRESIDPDNYALPAVRDLITLLRTPEPSPQEVSEAAARCLVRTYVLPPGPRGPDGRSDEAIELVVPMPTFSPLRDFADSAEGVFSSLLATVQASFPAIPAPTWMWEL